MQHMMNYHRKSAQWMAQRQVTAKRHSAQKVAQIQLSAQNMESKYSVCLNAIDCKYLFWQVALI